MTYKSSVIHMLFENPLMGEAEINYCVLSYHNCLHCTPSYINCFGRQLYYKKDARQTHLEYP